NSQDELIEIYRLSAITATVLGQPEVAEQFYRRWLAILPTATLPERVAPKLREPFKAAQAYMATRSRLSAKAERHTAGGTDQIDVIVDADPLAMAASIAIDNGAPQRIGADRRAHFERPSSAVVEIAILDEAGNHLLDL